MATVFLVHHQYPDDDENLKFLGAYSTQETATAAIAAVAGHPGFCDHPDGFTVVEHDVDPVRPGWSEGFRPTPEGIDLPAWMFHERSDPPEDG